MTATTPRPSPTLFSECALWAIVLTPQRPIANWLVELDGLLEEHRHLFVARAVLLDLSVLQPKKVELRALLAELNKRKIRIMAVEGTDLIGLGMPPLVNAASKTDLAEP